MVARKSADFLDEAFRSPTPERARHAICPSHYDGASPDGSRGQRSITRVHQDYGRNYQLPNTTAHNETCANIGTVLWNWRMFLASGQAKLIDVAEFALYNSVLSGVGLNGKDYFYTNPPRQHDPAPVKLRWSRTLVPFVTSFCCPPNLVRTVAAVGGYAYSKSDDAIWVNLYGSNTLTTELGGSLIRLEQRTAYPWDGEIEITVVQSREAPLDLRLRIPGWATSAEVELEGAATSPDCEPGSYVQVRWKWKTGEKIRLRLEMPSRLIEPHPLVDSSESHQATEI